MSGMLALVIYSFGFMIPFLISTLFMDQLVKLGSGDGEWMRALKVVMGLVMIVVGVLLYTNEMYIFMSWFV